MIKRNTQNIDPGLFSAADIVMLFKTIDKQYREGLADRMTVASFVYSVPNAPMEGAHNKPKNMEVNSLCVSHSEADAYMTIHNSGSINFVECTGNHLEAYAILEKVGLIST